MKRAQAWLPGLVLGLGALATSGVDMQRALPLEAPLAESIPVVLNDRRSEELTIAAEELAVAAPSAYLLRQYAETEQDAGFSLYVGFYEQQSRGSTIHSPRNCLPGAGWEVLAARTEPLVTTLGIVEVNHYLLQNGDQQAVVLYWYQGRGRIEANEYRVKWNLLRDAITRRRSDEALVRVVVPVRGDREAARDLALAASAEIAEALERALPQ